MEDMRVVREKGYVSRIISWIEFVSCQRKSLGRLLEHTQYLSVIDSGIFQSGASKREVGDGNKAYLSPTVAWLRLENVGRGYAEVEAVPLKSPFHVPLMVMGTTFLK